MIITRATINDCVILRASVEVRNIHGGHTLHSPSRPYPRAAMPHRARRAASYVEVDSDWDVEDDERPPSRCAKRPGAAARVVQGKVTAGGHRPSAPPVARHTLPADDSDDEAQSLAPPCKVPRVSLRMAGPGCTGTQYAAAPADDVASLLEGALAAFRALPRADPQSLHTAQAALAAQEARNVHLARELVAVKKALEDKEVARRQEAAAAAADMQVCSAARDKLAAQVAHHDKLSADAALGKASGGVRVVDEVLRIMDSVMAKLNVAYTAEYKRLTNASWASAASSGASSGGVAWCVLLDSGVAHELPADAQTKIDHAVAAGRSPTGRTTIVDAYTQPHPHNARSTFSYNVHIDVDLHGALTVTQMNTETSKERTLCRRVPSPAGSAVAPLESPDLCMNKVTVSLEDETGRYIFEDELRDMLALSVADYRGIGCKRAPTPALIDLATTFSAPFRGLDFSLGTESESWCRCASLRDFLAYGKELFQDDGSWRGSGSPACFVWAHGTRNRESINADYFGLNTVYSADGSFRGKGVYVAANDYVASLYSSTFQTHASEYVLGVALTSTNGTFLVDRYRLPITVRDEPAAWSHANTPNAIYLPNAQINCAFPFGFVHAP